MSVNSGKEFLALVEKSKILADPTFVEIREKFDDDSDPGQIASALVESGHLTAWQAKFFLTGRHKLKIGQYVLLDRFQKDQLGDRFLARHQQLDRKVDVHLFPRELCNNKQLFDNFLEQAAQVAQLDHPNLLHLYDIDRENERYYFVFEHEQGFTVEKAPIGSFSSFDIACIVSQALDGLIYAHANDILHGKLNESQLRWSDDGQIRIRNVGLIDLFAKLSEATTELDEYNVPAQSSDDISAVGTIGRKLFQQHIGKALNAGDQQLVAMLGSISKFMPGQSLTPDEFKNKLDDWIENHRPRPQSESSSTASESSSGISGDDSSSALSSASFGQASSVNRNRILAVIGVIVLLAVGYGGYRVFSGPDRTSQKDLDPGAEASGKMVQANNKNTNNNASPDTNEAKKNSESKTSNPKDSNSSFTDAVKRFQDTQPKEKPESTVPKEVKNDVAKTNIPSAVAKTSAKTESTDDKSFDPFDLPDEKTEKPKPNPQPKDPKPEPGEVKPFVNFSTMVSIPEYEKGKSIPDAKLLGQVVTGDGYLLGIELVSDQGFSRTPAEFELVRNEGDKNLWEIGFRERSKDEWTPVAKLIKNQEQLIFQWLNGVKQKPNANYLRNCLLKLNARDQTHLVKPRTPANLDAIEFTDKKSVIKKSLDVRWLPHASNIKLQIMELPEGLVQQPVYDPPDRLISVDLPNFSLFFDEKPENRWLGVRVNSDFGSRIKLDTALQMNTPDGAKPYKAIQFKRLGDFIMNRQRELQQDKFHADNYQPVQGEKTKHKEYIKELSKKLDVVNIQVENFGRASEVVKKILENPIRYRVYFEVNGTQIDLVAIESPSIESAK